MVPVIVNPHAGPAGADGAARIVEALSAHGLRADLRYVEPPEVPAAAWSAARASRLVAVAGGDGTLSAAAGALVGTDALLAPLPLGTLNHFARRLGIATVEAGAEALARGRPVWVPVGSAGSRTFIHHASAGLYPQIVRYRRRLPGWLGRRLGTAAAAAAVVARLRTMPVLLEAEGAPLERTTVGVWIGLGHGTFRVPVDRHPPEGDALELVVSSARTRTALAIQAARALRCLLRGESLEAAGLEVLRSERITLGTTEPLDLSLDGEVERAEPPVELAIRPRALRVLSLPAEPAPGGE